MRSARQILALIFSVTLGTSNPPAQTVDLIRSSPRPIAAHESLFVEELTWMEVRDAMKAGKSTVIIPTGGVEQNGPYLITGKHNFVVRAVSESIARKLGNALVAPVVPFVPEGNIEPPTGHMKYPGTISVTEETFERLLIDICGSFHAHGFTDIVMIGDSGGNQKGMKTVAAKLNGQWRGKGSRVHFIPEFYDTDLNPWLAKQGIRQQDEGLHDDFIQSAMLASIDPLFIRTKQRLAAGKFQINGLNLAPVENTAEWGRKIVAERTEISVKSIRQSIKSGR